MHVGIVSSPQGALQSARKSIYITDLLNADTTPNTDTRTAAAKPLSASHNNNQEKRSAGI